jgi:hypothetical protein
MPNRPNVLSLEVLGELNYDGFQKDLQRLQERISLDTDAKNVWLKTRREIEKYARGTSKRKNPPWKGASEMVPPLIKKLLKRWIPIVYNLIALADPITHFFAGKADEAMKAQAAEEFFDWLIRVHMDNVLGETATLAHGVGLGGQDYVAVDWHYQTELENRVAISENLFPQGVPQDPGQVLQVLQREYDITTLGRDLKQQFVQAAQALIQGAPAVKLTFRRVTKDKPRFSHIDTGRVIVPPTSAACEDADYVCIVHDFTPGQMRQMALDGTLNPEAVAQLIERAEVRPTPEAPTSHVRDGHSNYDTIERAQMEEAGVWDTYRSKGIIRIHQVYAFMDTNGDGIGERVVLWYAPLNRARQHVLAVHDFPFSMKMWPIVRFDYEKVDRRPYRSQGIGQQLLPIQEQLTKQFRAQSDAIDIQLAPVFQARTSSGLKARNIKWGPGKVVPVNDIGDIAPIEKSPFNLDKYIMNDAQLRQFAEEMIGSHEAALTATGAKLERRTATEVQTVSATVNAMQSMDASVWQMSMAKVFQIIWEMWMDLGPDEIYFQVVGEQEPKPFKKSQYNYKYQLVPAGTPGNTDRNQELSMMVQFTQLALQGAPDLINRPFLFYRIAKLMDRRFADQVMLPPAVQQAIQSINAAASMIASGQAPETLQAISGVPGQEGGPA